MSSLSSRCASDSDSSSSPDTGISKGSSSLSELSSLLSGQSSTPVELKADRSEVGTVEPVVLDIPVAALC